MLHACTRSRALHFTRGARARPALARIRRAPRLPHRSLLTLAIETSCDDTAVAVLETHDDDEREAGKNGGSATLHFNQKITADNAKYKGVHPVIALESHQESLATLVAKALDRLPTVNVTSDSDSSGSGKQPPYLHPLPCATGPPKRRPDFISVTRGPGMRSNLSVGLDTAKGLALGLQVPLVGVHHMQAHALTPRLVSALHDSQRRRPLSGSASCARGPQLLLDPDFPFLTLLVSGGHTMLLRSGGLVEHSVLAETSDVAIGDAIDKIARYVLPGEVIEGSRSVMYGPLLEKFAFPEAGETASSTTYEYQPPRTRAEEMAVKPSRYGWYLSPPLSAVGGGKKSRSLEFSFTGLVSAVDRFMKYEWSHDHGKLTKTPRSADVSADERRVMAREAMRVAFEHLAGRIVLALHSAPGRGNLALENVNALVVSGGVASNGYLRHVLRAFLDARGFEHVRLLFPPPSLCTDNAAMIAWAGIEMFRAGYRSELSIRPVRKWSMDSKAEDGGILGVGGVMVESH